MTLDAKVVQDLLKFVKEPPSGWKPSTKTQLEEDGEIFINKHPHWQPKMNKAIEDNWLPIARAVCRIELNNHVIGTGFT